jgi:glycine/D-amino acid oxidase-like deaminating enzyme
VRGVVEADVAIVGGGITGSATALWLAREGARVALVEGRRIAAGASGRNGGFLLSGTAETYAAAVKRYGREQTRRIWAFNVANHDAASELAAELMGRGWPCGFRRTGSLRIAACEAERAELDESLALLREDGWEAEPVTRGALPPSLRAAYVGATFYPRDGEIQPARFVRGIARLAEGAGATIYEDSPVTDVSPTGAGWAVRTAGGEVRAPKALLATNAWLPELGRRLGLAWLAGAVAPTRGQMLATSPVAERLFDCPCYADQGYQYWRQLPDGRLVVGGWRNASFATENSDDETPNPLVQDRLEDFVRSTLGLPDVQIEQRWAGIMAFSPDGLPLIGAIPDLQGCYVAGGYTGHGNAYAIRAGRVVAALMLGRAHPDVGLFDPARFAPGDASAAATPAGAAVEHSGEGM